MLHFFANRHDTSPSFIHACFTLRLRVVVFMGFLKPAPGDAHLGMMSRGTIHEVVYRKMVMFICFCWFLVANSLCYVTKFVAIHIFRINEDGTYHKDDSSFAATTKGLEPVPEATEVEETLQWDFGPPCDEEEISCFSFKFQHQFPDDTVTRTADLRSYSFLSEQDFCGFMEEPEAMTIQIQESYLDCSKDSVFDREKPISELIPPEEIQQSDIVSKLSESEESKDLKHNTSDEQVPISSFEEEQFNGFIENNEENLGVELGNGFLSANDFPQSNAFDELSKSDESKVMMPLKIELLGNEPPFSGFDSDVESGSSSDGYSVKDLVVDLDSDAFLSERDFPEHEIESDVAETSVNFVSDEDQILKDVGEFVRKKQDIHDFGEFVDGKNQIEQEYIKNELQSERREHVINPEELQNHMDTQLELTDSSNDRQSSCRIDRSHRTRSSSSDDALSVKDRCSTKTMSDDFNGENADITSDSEWSDDEDHSLNLDSSDHEFNVSFNRNLTAHGSLDEFDVAAIVKDSNELLREIDDFQGKLKSPEEELQKSEETGIDAKDSDDQYDDLESLWEHQDLIEQLRMEIKKVRAIGLPTILEETESPKTVDDLKPWKLEEKFLRENPMDELQKFYKSYRERMRKFDILNYQKMYAIGFLQLKDPLQSMGTQKPLLPAIMSQLSNSFWPFHRRKSSNDPSESFLKDLRIDLETVYVAQTCLSWEFLRWQYEKYQGLPENDPYRSHQYNQVAGEFQQFQVIIQRFIENESFQGPRLANYVKNRCVLRNLLQVPVIKEDCFKDKMEEQRKDSNAITSEMLEDIMEESIRIFWEFVKADKNGTPVIFKGLLGAHVELQDPLDFQLMVDTHTILQKKEKQLKDVMKTGNCLVKKFKKPQENRSNQALLFSQVELKLVAMVLKKSRITTDQLVWCQKKLSKIILSRTKVRRDPSFLLFPC